MKPSVIYRGFVPKDEVIFLTAECLEKLNEASPYDSSIEASINKDGGAYTMVVRIRYSEGTFENTARSFLVTDVILKTVEPILAEIALWAQNRAFEELNSVDWHGSLLTFLENSETNALPETQPRSGPVNVLIVDDDVESIVPLRKCLQKLGCSTNTVTSGFDAIHELLSGERAYDMIFLDWRMPEMSGLQALQNAQKVISHAPSVKDHWRDFQVPVILFSGCAVDESELSDWRDFRFIDHWQKAMSYKSLFEKVSDAFLHLKKIPLET